MEPQQQKKKLSLAQAMGALIVIVICIAIGVAAANQQNADQVTVDATYYAGATATTESATATEKAIPREAKISQAVHNDIHKVTTITYEDAAHTQLDITSDVSEYQLTNGTTRGEIQLQAYDTFKDMFTHHSYAVQQVTITWTGQVVDSYGNTSTATIGMATLTAPTASLFNWDNLDFGQAWADYDATQFFHGL